MFTVGCLFSYHRVMFYRHFDIITDAYYASVFGSSYSVKIVSSENRMHKPTNED